MIPALSHRGRTALPSALAFALTVALVATWGSATVAASSRNTSAVIAPSQELTRLLGPHVAMSAPDAHSIALQRVETRRPITGEQTVLPVLDHETSADGRRWLRVRLPGRPNGRSGWIAQRGTNYAVTRWHLLIDIGERRVTVYESGRPVRVFAAVVGKPSTPTPQGQFFVEEDIQLRPSDVGAPDALALSARSNVLQEFDGGPGQIAVHGLANIGGLLGSAVTHGCVRLASNAMRWLVDRIGPGVPVTIK